MVYHSGDRTATRTEIWDLREAVGQMWDTFDVLVLRVILWSFGAVVSSLQNIAICHTNAVVKHQNELKCGA